MKYEPIPDEEGGVPVRSHRTAPRLIVVGLLVAGAVGAALVTKTTTAPSVLVREQQLSAASSRIALSFDNEYIDKPGQAYPFLAGKHVVEPQRATTLTVRLAASATASATALTACSVTAGDAEGAAAPATAYDEIPGVTTRAAFQVAAAQTARVSDTEHSLAALVFPQPSTYKVAVTCTLADGSVEHLEAETTCMYVRREIRRMSDRDRDEYLNAITYMSNTPSVTGQKTYGAHYNSLAHFEVNHLRAAGQREVDHMHGGLGFLTNHISMTNEFELGIQSIAPRVTVPFWDFTIDEQKARNHKGEEVFSDVFLDSELWTADWFGATDEAVHTVTEGRFAYQQVPMDANFSTVSPYGYLRAPWNINPSSYVTKYHKACGNQVGEKMPSCGAHFMMAHKETYDTWYAFAWEMELKPHALIHSMLGGVGGECESKWDKMHADGLVDHTQLDNLKVMSFVILKNLWRAFLIEMPTGCSTENPVQECMWKCGDITAIADKVSGTIKDWYDNPNWEEITQIAFCETAFWPGDHLEAASAVEPSFWMIHPTLDRLLQYKDLAQPFTDKTWITADSDGEKVCTYASTSDCEGHHPYDRTFFTTVVKVGSAYVKKFMTGEELRNALLPSSSDYAMPYIYENFEWEHCEADGYYFKTLTDSSSEAKLGTAEIRSQEATDAELEEMTHMQKVFDATVNDGAFYILSCPNVTYGYCGDASCASASEGVAACGCKLLEGKLGKFSIDLASTTLIRSRTYREGVMLAVEGYNDEAATKVCGALRDGSIWAEAGYSATTFGSFYHTTVADGEAEEASSFASSDSSTMMGSCMGAPCLSLNWGGGQDGCSVTCMCPDFVNDYDADDDGGCFKNGELDVRNDQNVSWAQSLPELLTYTTRLANKLASFDHAALEAAQGCTDCTVILE